MQHIIPQATTHSFGGGDRVAYATGTEGYIESLFVLSCQNLPFTQTNAVITGESDLKPQEYLPDGFEVFKQHVDRADNSGVLLATADDALIFLRFQPKSYVKVIVSAANAQHAEQLTSLVSAKIPQPALNEDQVSLSLWQASLDGADSTVKKITAPAWTEIERNYAAKTREAVTSLMKTDKLDDTNGKIILWHGPPGTGKTSAIRALMREWKSWCTSHYISDPEKMFMYPSYLLKVGAHSGNKYRMIIAEDTDEFLRVDAKAKSGASLSRLLNFSDGLLGQGCKVLFLLTTNEPIGKLQPALLRPGRCLAQTEFTPFTGAEVVDWLPDGHRPPIGNKTLAELYEHINDQQQQINTGFGKANPIGFGA